MSELSMKRLELVQGDRLELVERPVPAPGPGQVLVRLRASSLNYRDLLIRKSPTARRPLVPLSDGAGEVVEVGAGVQAWKPGDRVAGNFFQGWVDGPQSAETNATALGGSIDGVLAEYACFEEGGLVRIPEHLSFEEAATLPCAALTAWNGLFEWGGLKAGETVLAQGTGGVSIFALQFAKAAGARVILSSSSDAKLARGRALGADELINYRSTPDWASRALELQPGGVHHILEVGGEATMPDAIRATRPGGHITQVGLLSGAKPDLKATEKAAPDHHFFPVYVGSTRMFQRMNAFIAQHGIRPVIDRVFRLEEAAEAYSHLESGNHFGKLVIQH